MDSDDLLTHNRATIMDSMSTLKTFEFIGEMPHDQIPIYEEIIRGAPQLGNLALDIAIHLESEIYLRRLDLEFFLVNKISALSNLRITRAVMVEGSLIQALQHCRTTLTHLTMRHVALAMSDEGWLHVAQILLAMPKLVFVELQMIPTWGSTSTLFFVPHADGCQESHIFGGRERVLEGMQGLLTSH